MPEEATKMSDTMYLTTLSNEDTDEFVTYAYGRFDVMNYATKAGLALIDGQDGDFAGRIVEVENAGQSDEKRTVVSVRGDAETVAVVLRKKIARERKEQFPKAETPAADDAETESNETSASDETETV